MNHVTIDMNEIILRVGFEIHQQLSTQNNYFATVNVWKWKIMIRFF